MRNAKSQALKVCAVSASIRSMPVIIEVPGVIEAEKSVAVTSQVAGIIKRIAFTPGEEVKQKQLLFELEPATFLQALEQARANLQRDLVNLEQNKVNSQRLQALVSSSDVSKQEAENAKMLELAQEASVAASQAQVRQAEIQLGYTKIFSPMQGKAGIINIKEGGYAAINGSLPLVIINKVDTVLVDFYLPQKQLSIVLQQQKQGNLPAEIMTESNDKILGTGKLVFIDNKINEQTGTILLKVELANQEQLFLPGMIVAVRLIVKVDTKAVVIPNIAVQTDQQGHFVYCIENNRAIIRRIKVSRQDREWAVIEQGIQEGDRVITLLSPNLHEGSLVKEKVD
jgi:multidrug efflux system membrane fusion protein